MLNVCTSFTDWYIATIIKSMHHHLVSDINIGPSILCTLLQPGRHRLDTFPGEVERNSSKSVLNLLFQFICWSSA
jgi:hypothetical protein